MKKGTAMLWDYLMNLIKSLQSSSSDRWKLLRTKFKDKQQHYIKESNQSNVYLDLSPIIVNEDEGPILFFYFEDFIATFPT